VNASPKDFASHDTAKRSDIRPNGFHTSFSGDTPKWMWIAPVLTECHMTHQNAKISPSIFNKKI